MSRGKLILIEPDTLHNFTAERFHWLRLMVIYSPPKHPDGLIQETKVRDEEYMLSSPPREPSQRLTTIGSKVTRRTRKTKGTSSAAREQLEKEQD